MASNGLARYALGAAFPLFTVQSEWSIHKGIEDAELTGSSVSSSGHRVGDQLAWLPLAADASHPMGALLLWRQDPRKEPLRNAQGVARRDIRLQTSDFRLGNV
jgi:hypothetical protein